MATLVGIFLIALGFVLGRVAPGATCARCDRPDARLPGGGYQPLPAPCRWHEKVRCPECFPWLPPPVPTPSGGMPGGGS